MIIQPPSQDAADAKRREAEAQAREVPEARTPADDPPPTYTQGPETTPLPNATALAGPSQPVKQPHNFITMHRDNGSVKGSWLIDPCLTIPRTMLPPLLDGETEENRRNLNIHASNGTIEVDLTLAATTVDKGALGRKRTTFDVNARNGTIRFAVFAPYTPRLPFHLRVRAANGTINLTIPRSFHGLITLVNRNGSAKFQGSTVDQLHTFSEVNGTRKCFIGDYSVLSDDDEWGGDEIVVEANNGRTRIQYEGEVIEKDPKQRGFFSRLLGINHRRDHRHGHRHEHRDGHHRHGQRRHSHHWG